MKNICIIPARGGSKRIPKKNIKDFLGKPIIAYSIGAALESNLFDEVMVSTDDLEIAKIAKQYGAKVPFLRSATTANDNAGLEAVIDEVLSEYAKNNCHFTNFCCILATAPFITPQLLQQTFSVFSEEKFDTLRPIVRFSYPIQRSFRIDAKNNVSFMFPEYKNSRSQDLETSFHDAGLFYWGSTMIGFKGKKWGGYEIDENLCQDIDTLKDWDIAEQKFKILKTRS